MLTKLIIFESIAIVILFFGTTSASISSCSKVHKYPHVT